MVIDQMIEKQPGRFQGIAIVERVVYAIRYVHRDDGFKKLILRFPQAQTIFLLEYWSVGLLEWRGNNAATVATVLKTGWEI
jgi:hypothetical protein